MKQLDELIGELELADSVAMACGNNDIGGVIDNWLSLAKGARDAFRKKLESKNAELREKLAAAEHKLEYMEIAENTELEAVKDELARLKSHEGQWAVTCEGMTKDEAYEIEVRLNNRVGDDRIDYQAVPLHVPAEDGPWVVRVDRPRVGYLAFSKTIKCRPSYCDFIGDATTFLTEDDARQAIFECCGGNILNPQPVRLADVERESGKPDA